ncbi:MAG: choice-of-anchor B domain-containing protein [Planctomycetota bacterium]|jgi:choice-of-anchor B domain-containing protein
MNSKQLTFLFFTILFLNVFAQKNVDFLGNLQFEQKINDIWGYEDINGNEYALIGGEQGTFIVDVSIPTNPTQLFFIPGDTTIWRDLKTYQDFAYVTNESAGGLLIIDLSDLPNSIDYQRSTIDTFNYQKAHNIFIDENGIAHLFGSNIQNQGDFMLDLNTTNRFEPTFYGLYNDRYCHDGYAKNNILWTSEINQGDFSVVDFSDPQNQIITARQNTSTSFTHNCWLSDDENYLITTDEKSGAYVDIYDVTNLNNIQLLDKYRSSPDDDVIPHNTFFKGNDFIITSYYRDGITIVDATEKNNLVEVGQFDTSPFPSADGFEGCWGVYPYLTSGIILASDRAEGLFVLNPTYKRACYIEGSIIDTNSFIPISNVRVEIIGSKQIKNSLFDGSYTLGIADSGVYDIRFSLPHCQTIIVSGVALLEGQIKQLDIETNCAFPTAISNLQQEKDYVVSPNPSNDFFKIDFNSNNTLETVQIFNLTGKLIKEIAINANKGQLIIQNDWPAGNYIANMIFEGEIFQEILVKK